LLEILRKFASISISSRKRKTTPSAEEYERESLIGMRVRGSGLLKRSGKNYMTTYIMPAKAEEVASTNEV
jgi:hypothetical protein